MGSGIPLWMGLWMGSGMGLWKGFRMGALIPLPMGSRSCCEPFSDEFPRINSGVHHHLGKGRETLQIGLLIP